MFFIMRLPEECPDPNYYLDYTDLVKKCCEANENGRWKPLNVVWDEEENRGETLEKDN